jgi:ABC-type spermidine/putrescine transport system permease subunit I
VTATLSPTPHTADGSVGDDESSRHRTRTAVWAAMAAPGTAWLVLLFAVPVYAILAVAFGGIDPILRTTRPEWNPLAWDFSAFTGMLERSLDRDDLGKVFIRTGLFALAALAGCCLIGYPVAYFVARSAKRSRGLLLTLLVLPFWISYLMRMLAWVNLLQTDGYINRVLGWLQLPDNRNWLDGDWPTVVLGLVYGYIRSSSCRCTRRSSGSTDAGWRPLATSVRLASGRSCGSRCRCRCPGSSPRR